jgi:chromosome segregation ATPase
VEETTRLTRLLEAAAARCDAAERRAEEIGRQHERERGEFEREVGRLRGMASSFSDEARMSMHFNSAELGEARRRAADAEANLCAASEALETASRDAESAKRDAESAKRDAEAAKGEREIAMRDKSTAEMEKEVAVRERDCAVEKLEAAEASSRHRVEELEGEVEGLCALAEEERRAKVEAEESMKLVNVQLEVFRAEERCRGAEWEAARATLEDQNKRCDLKGVPLFPLLLFVCM